MEPEENFEPQQNPEPQPTQYIEPQQIPEQGQANSFPPVVSRNVVGSSYPTDNKKKFIIIGVVATSILIVGVLAYGLVNGIMTRNYARFIKTTWDEKYNAMNVGYVDFSNDDGLKKQMDTITTVSAEATSTLEARKAPYKATKVREESIGYFKALNAIGSESEKYIDVAAEYQKVFDTFGRMGSTPPISDAAGAITTFKTIKTTIDSSKKQMESITVPDSMSKMQQGFIGGFDSFSSALTKLINGYEIADVDSINAGVGDLNVAMGKFNLAVSAMNAASTDLVNRYKAEETKSNTTADDVEAFVNKYQNSWLVY